MFARSTRFTWRKVKPLSQDRFIAAGTYPRFCSMNLYGKLVYRRSLPRNLLGFPNKLARTTISSARARARTALSVVERTNHEATAPPILALRDWVYINSLQHALAYLQSSTRYFKFKKTRERLFEELQCVWLHSIPFRYFQEIMIGIHLSVTTWKRPSLLATSALTQRHGKITFQWELSSMAAEMVGILGFYLT